MKKENAIKIFEQKQVRSYWDEGKELWYISVIDVIAVLTDSIDPQAYWRKLKQRLKEEGNETVTNLHDLKMRAKDGKKVVTSLKAKTMLEKKNISTQSSNDKPKNK